MYLQHQECQIPAKLADSFEFSLMQWIINNNCNICKHSVITPFLKKEKKLSLQYNKIDEIGDNCETTITPGKNIKYKSSDCARAKHVKGKKRITFLK